MSYPSDRLHEEVAFLCYHMRWDLNAVLGLDHLQRQRWLEELSGIHRQQMESM